MQKILLRPLMAVACGLVCGASLAAVPVVDLDTSQGRQPARTQPAQPATAAPQSLNAAADLHYQLQILQDEIRTLRGMVEEQANEIRMLKQRQMDDYMDLDRRLSGNAGTGSSGRDLGNGSGAGSGTASSGSMGSGTDNGGNASVAPANQQEQLQDYTAAYNLLKDRKIDEAIAAFNQHIARYPNGPYVANAHYWLGEIYLLQNELPRAETAFAAVVNNFPAHRKAGDAGFKLGKVYHLEGKNDKAKAVLQKVANGGSGAADLARAYLRDNF